MLVWIAVAFGSGIAVGDWLGLGTGSSALLVLAAAGAPAFAGVLGPRLAAAAVVMAVGGLHEPAALVKLAGEGGGATSRIERRIARWRARMLDDIGRRLEGEQRALVASLVAGDRGDIPRALDDDFRRARGAHALSGSGLPPAGAGVPFFPRLAR